MLQKFNVFNIKRINKFSPKTKRSRKIRKKGKHSNAEMQFAWIIDFWIVRWKIHEGKFILKPKEE